MSLLAAGNAPFDLRLFKQNFSGVTVISDT